jgi:hypothetical protein
MDDQARLAELRELFLQAPESGAVQLLAFTLSVVLFAVVLWLVRRRTLRAEYTPIWMAVALATLVVGVNLDVLRGLARTLGAWTISSTLFFLGEFFLLAICLNYAVRLSQAGARIQELAQEVALLRRRLDDWGPGPAAPARAREPEGRGSIGG